MAKDYIDLSDPKGEINWTKNTNFTAINEKLSKDYDKKVKDAGGEENLAKLRRNYFKGDKKYKED